MLHLNIIYICDKKLKWFVNSIYMLHINNPCYKKFTVYISIANRKDGPSEKKTCLSSSLGQPSKTFNVYPNECNLCRKS